MSDFKARELADIARIFLNLGAPETKAKVMASQLLKRAEQIAEERGFSKVEATAYLLKKVLEARRGS